MEGKTVLDEDADIYRHPDENLSEKEKLQRMDRRGKWQYFKDYYSRYVLVALIVVMCIAALAIFAPTGKTETVLYVGFINDNIKEEAENVVKEELESVLSYDSEKESVLFDYTLFFDPVNGGYLTNNTITVLAEQFYTGNIDLLVAEPEVWKIYEEQEAFKRLDEVMTSKDFELLEQYKYNDYAISLKNSEKYHSFASLKEPVIGFPAKGKRTERAVQFLKYLLEL